MNQHIAVFLPASLADASGPALEEIMKRVQACVFWVPNIQADEEAPTYQAEVRVDTLTPSQADAEDHWYLIPDNFTGMGQVKHFYKVWMTDFDGYVSIAYRNPVHGNIDHWM